MPTATAARKLAITTHRGTRLAVLQQAERYLGRPSTDVAVTHTSGTSPQTGFDCSGLVYEALTNLGVQNAPRDTVQQFQFTQRITAAQLLPGDLIFSNWQGDSLNPGHVGIYLGGGKVLQSPGSTTGHVEVIALKEYAGHIAGYGRLPNIANANATPVVRGTVSGITNKVGGLFGKTTTDPTGTYLEVYDPFTPGATQELNSATGKGSWTTTLWAATVLTLANLPVTKVNIDNLDRMIRGESAGQSGGWLRDNNPLNIGTYPGVTSAAYGGKLKTLADGSVVNTFANPLAGAEATARDLQAKNNSALYHGLRSNVPAKMFGGLLLGSEWKGASYAGAKSFVKLTPYGATGAAVTGTGATTPTGASAAGAATPGGSVGSFLTDLGLPNVNWAQVGIFLGGAALLTAGLILYVTTSAGPKILERVP